MSDWKDFVPGLGIPGVGNWWDSSNAMGLTRDPNALFPKSQYEDSWNQLIQQLRQQASGQGPSLAEQQYRKAFQDTQNAAVGMSRGNRPGSARAGEQALTTNAMGLEQGSSMARLAEQMQAQQALNQAIQGASAAEFQRQQAKAQIPSQLQQLAGIGGQVAGMVGMMSGAPPMPMMGAPPAQGMPQGMQMYSNGSGQVMAPQMPPMTGPNDINQNQFQPAGQGQPYAPWGNSGGY